MKKLKIIFLLLFPLFVFSCYLESKENDSPVNTITFKQSNFDDTDIIYNILSEKQGSIEKVQLIVKIDTRLKNLSKIADIKHIDLTIGNTAKLTHLQSDADEIKTFTNIRMDKEHELLIIDINLPTPISKDIDIITIFFLLDNREKHVLENTDPYYYKNSVKLLGVENTFLDQTSFKNANVLVKKIIKNKNIQEIELTIKVTDQSIDDIKDIHVNLISNGELYNLDFIHSIYINSVAEKNKSHGCKLLGFNRPDRSYIVYFIDISKLKIQKIDSIAIKLNDHHYYSNKL